MKTLKEQMHAAYLDYVNNFLTIEKFAENYGISYFLANQMILEMKDYHESLAKKLVFRGTKEECKKYMADRNIPLGDDYGFYLRKFSSYWAIEKEWE